MKNLQAYTAPSGTSFLCEEEVVIIVGGGAQAVVPAVDLFAYLDQIIKPWVLEGLGFSMSSEEYDCHILPHPGKEGSGP